MLKDTMRLSFLFFALASVLAAQTINPNQINWPLSNTSLTSGGAFAATSLTAPLTNNVQTVGAATGSDYAQISAAITAAGPSSVVNLTPKQLYVINTPLVISNNYVVFNFNGACIETTQTGNGITITGSQDQMINMCMIPGAASTGSAIEDAGWGFTLSGWSVAQLHGNYPSTGYYWYHIIQIDGGESENLYGGNGQANIPPLGYVGAQAQAVTRCDSTFCGSAIYNPPTGSAVAAIYGTSLSMGCSGNSIDWEGGNALYLYNVIMQSYNQYGMKLIKGGAGAGKMVAHGLYASPTNCTGLINSTVGNPALNGAQGSTEIIAGAAMNVVVDSADTLISGGNGVTATTCTTTPCTEVFGYYEVVHQSTSFTYVTKPMFFGWTGPTINASFTGSSVTVVAPCDGVSGDTYDFLAVDQTSSQSGPIFGSVNTYAVTGEQGVTCSGTYLTFTDTGARSSYSWPSEPSYVPDAYNVAIGLNGWSGAALVLNGNADSHATYTGPCPYAGGIIIPTYVKVYGQPYVTCTLGTTDGFSGNSSGNTAGITHRSSGMNYQTYAPSAVITPAWYKYTASSLKGLYNLGPNDSGWTWAGGPTCFLTLIDSNPWKTEALPGNRPTWDAGDTSVCVDQASAGLTFMDPTSISNYINHVPDNSSWLERLTSSAKTFTVPVFGPSFAAQTKYSHAGTQLASCASTIDSQKAYVLDASSLTPGTAYSVTAGAGTVHTWVECVYSGSAYAWQTM